MVSFILLLFRGVSTKKLFKLFMDGGERKKSFSECLSLLILSLILSLMFHSMLHTIKFLDGSSKMLCCSFFFDFKLCHIASSFQNSAEAFGTHYGGD